MSEQDLKKDFENEVVNGIDTDDNTKDYSEAIDILADRELTDLEKTAIADLKELVFQNSQLNKVVEGVQKDITFMKWLIDLYEKNIKDKQKVIDYQKELLGHSYQEQKKQLHYLNKRYKKVKDALELACGILEESTDKQISKLQWKDNLMRTSNETI